MPQISLKNTKLYIIGGDTGEAIEVINGEGNVTWDESRTIEYALNRGKIAEADGGTTREGDDVPISVSFDVRWDEYTGDTGVTIPTPPEALKQEGDASTWTSTSSDACSPYAVDLLLERYMGTCFTTGGGIDPYESYYFSLFRYESISHDVDAGTMSVSGTCQVTKVTNARGTASIVPTLST